MAEAQGAVGREKLPQKCRGRHPHLNAFDTDCDARPALIMMGASNLWFAVHPIDHRHAPHRRREEASCWLTGSVSKLGVDQSSSSPTKSTVIRAMAGAKNMDVSGVPTRIWRRNRRAFSPARSDEERREEARRLGSRRTADSRVAVPAEAGAVPAAEERQRPDGHRDAARAEAARPISRVVAVNQMKKVNAVLGFTRLDEMDRVNDLASRLVKLTRNGRPTWVPATEDRGEGIFLQLDLDAVDAWEQTILDAAVGGPPAAHRRNFRRRFSETAKRVDPDTRLPAPRYWLLHTLSHMLIREMAMSCGYGAASLTERIYGWPDHPRNGKPQPDC